MSWFPSKRYSHPTLRESATPSSGPRTPPVLRAWMTAALSKGRATSDATVDCSVLFTSFRRRRTALPSLMSWSFDSAMCNLDRYREPTSSAGGLERAGQSFAVMSIVLGRRVVVPKSLRETCSEESRLSCVRKSRRWDRWMLVRMKIIEMFVCWKR